MKKNKLGLQPWLVPESVEFLDSVIEPHFWILEYGAGSSTYWFSQRAERVVSIEDHKKWFRKVSRMLQRRGVQNVALLFRPDYPYNRAVKIRPKKFDLILVDGKRRNGCIQKSIKALKPGGYFVLDNSNRVEYTKGKAILDKQFSNQRIFKSEEHRKWETGIWFN